MTNVFDAMKEEMLQKFPSIKTLPFLTRFAVWRGKYSESEIGWSHELEMGSTATAWQYAILVKIDGKEYIKRFGRLFR